jgi:hypothetical protein
MFGNQPHFEPGQSEAYSVYPMSRRGIMHQTRQINYKMLTDPQHSEARENEENDEDSGVISENWIFFY